MSVTRRIISHIRMVECAGKVGEEQGGAWNSEAQLDICSEKVSMNGRRKG